MRIAIRVLSFLLLLTTIGFTVDVKTEVEEWQKKRLTNLQKEDSWLTLVGFAWLKEGQNKFGSDETSDVPFPASAPKYCGSIWLEKGKARIEVAKDVPITNNDKPVTTMPLLADVDPEGPTILNLGSLNFYVIQRVGKYAIRIKDSQAPALKNFKGLDYFPIDPKLHIEAKWEPYNPPKKIRIVNILGQLEDYPCPGAIVFQIDGKTYRLEPVLEGDDPQLFIMFADKTNGKETYGAGRFLYADPAVDGKVILDFNKAYNPPCAFSPYATCPLPPPQNKLPIRIEAGEKSYKQHASRWTGSDTNTGTSQ